MNKEGQEEIVGFVFIVVIVSVIGIFFLFLSINQDNYLQGDSTEIYQFLESILYTTSSCSISYEPNYLSIKDLMQECSSGVSKCLSGEKPCDLLEESIIELIGLSFNIGDDASLTGYGFSSVFNFGESNEEIISINEGNCSSGFRGSEISFPSNQGVIITTMKVCFKS